MTTTMSDCGDNTQDEGCPPMPFVCGRGAPLRLEAMIPGMAAVGGAGVRPSTKTPLRVPPNAVSAR